MKKITFLIVLISLIVSCNKKLDYGSEETIFNVKDILLEKELKILPEYNELGISEDEIRNVFDLIKIKDMRLLSVSKEIKKYECLGTLYFDANNSIRNYIEEDYKTTNNPEDYRKIFCMDGFDVYYNLQETSDGETILEVKEIENFSQTILSYVFLRRMYIEKKRESLDPNFYN